MYMIYKYSPSLDNLAFFFPKQTCMGIGCKGVPGVDISTVIEN